MGVKFDLSQMWEGRRIIFKSKVIKKIFNLRDDANWGCEKLQNEEVHKLYNFPSYFLNNQITEEWRGGAFSIHIGKRNNILQGTREMIRPFAWPSIEGRIILNLILKVVWDCGCIELTQNRLRIFWRGVSKEKVADLRLLWKRGNSTSLERSWIPQEGLCPVELNE